MCQTILCNITPKRDPFDHYTHSQTITTTIHTRSCHSKSPTTQPIGSGIKMMRRGGHRASPFRRDENVEEVAFLVASEWDSVHSLRIFFCCCISEGCHCVDNFLFGSPFTNMLYYLLISIDIIYQIQVIYLGDHIKFYVLFVLLCQLHLTIHVLPSAWQFLLAAQLYEHAVTPKARPSVFIDNDT